MGKYCRTIAFALIAFSSIAAQPPAGIDQPDNRDTKGQQPDVSIHLVPYQAGINATTFGHDPEKMRQTATYQAAKRYGVDVTQDLSGCVVTRQKGASGFYLFHNIVRCEPKSPYTVQLVHQQIRNYPTEHGPPEINDHYLLTSIPMNESVRSGCSSQANDACTCLYKR